MPALVHGLRAASPTATGSTLFMTSA
jgi:hypothetical protein